MFHGCCVVPARALVISLHLLLTMKMVCMFIFHLHGISSPSSVLYCVSVPCDKLLCGWSGLPCGCGSPCGWGTLPCGWDYSYTAVEENHPVAVVACPVARVMQTCVAQVTFKSTVIGSLVDCPFACRIVADHSEWGNALWQE